MATSGLSSIVTMRLTGLSLLGMLAATTAVGCGDDGASPPVDAGVGADGSVGDAGAGIAEPATPVDPAPPALGPCPPGWREVTTDGATHCDPWTDGGRAVCTFAEAHFTGEPACRAIGTEAAGEWPEGLPSDGTVLYVRAGAAAGDGSMATPFGTIGEAMSRAGRGMIVAVARGSYDEIVTVRAGVTVWGASVAETIVTRTGPPDALRAVVTTAGADAVVRNLQITGSMNGADAVGAGRSLRLEDVLIDGVESVAVYVATSASFEADGLVVRDVASWDGRLGRGISVENGGIATVTGSVFERCAESALFVSLGGALDVADTAIDEMRERASDGTRGWGLIVLEDASATLSRVSISRALAGGIFALGPSATVTADQLVLRDTLGQPADGSATGILVQPGSTLSVTRTLIERTKNAAVWLDGADTVTFADVIVRDTTALDAPGPSNGGRAFLVQEGTSLEVDRALVDRTEGLAFAAFEASMRLGDVLVRDVTPSAIEPTFAYGVGLDTGGSVVAARVRIERPGIAGCVANAGTMDLEDVTIRALADGTAVQAQDAAAITARRVLVEDGSGSGLVAAGGTLTVEDAIVRRQSVSPSSGELGSGLAAGAGGHLTATRVRIEEATQVAIGIDAATMTLAEVQVAETRPRPSDGAGGHGVHVQRAGTVGIDRGLVERSGGAGIYVIGEGSQATLRDITVRDTQGARFMDVDGILGHGLSAMDGARVEVMGGLFERNREVGVVAFLDAQVTLVDVDVLDTLERACIASGCAIGGAGTGIAAFENATVTASRFAVRRSALAGVQLGRGGQIDLHEGEVTDNTVGANVQSDGFDVARLNDRVVYRDNGVNLDSTELPVPSAATVTSM